jgi:fatty-acid desaturase
MAPLPREQENLLVISSDDINPTEVTTVSEGSSPSSAASSTMKPTSKKAKEAAALAATSGRPTEDEPNVDPHYIPLLEFIPALLIGGAVWYACNYFKLYASTNTHWFAVFAVIQSIETFSPATSNMVQYVYPILLTHHYMTQPDYFPSTLQWAAFAPTVFFLIGVPMSVCLHRYFSHAAFTTTRLFQAVLGVVACFAYQGGPLWWSAKHVRHHHHCDQAQDPHSVVQQGFFYAFMGWTMNPTNLKQRDVKYNAPSLFVPELYFLDKFHLLPSTILFTILESQFQVHRSTIACNLLLPMLVCRLITLLFNVEYHPADDVKRCKSVDNPRWLAQIVGESEHDLHHKMPAKSHRGDWDLACTYLYTSCSIFMLYC